MRHDWTIRPASSILTLSTGYCFARAALGCHIAFLRLLVETAVDKTAFPDGSRLTAESR
jgi:hypothetical protein